jgi:hypothetical protein
VNPVSSPEKQQAGSSSSGEDGTSRATSTPAVSVPTMEVAAAALFLLVGSLVIYDSQRLGAQWGSDGPQSGYFPFYIGMMIVVSSLVLLVQGVLQGMRLGTWRRSQGRSGEDVGDASTVFVERGQLADVLKVFLPAVGYVLGIQLVGVYLSSALFIALFMRFIGNYPALRSASVGIGVAVVTFALFELWFRIPLPKGFLERAAGF